MTTTLGMREQLHAQATVIEIDTRARVRAAALGPLIDDTLVPHIAYDEELRLFLPVEVSLDRAGRPAEFPTDCHAMTVGVIACLRDRAVLGWVAGFLRRTRWHHVLRYAEVRDVSVQILRMRGGRPDRYAVDIHDGRTVWSVLMPEQISTGVADEYATELVRQLSGGGSVR
jgi:hypothetical protein